MAHDMQVLLHVVPAVDDGKTMPVVQFGVAVFLSGGKVWFCGTECQRCSHNHVNLMHWLV